MRTTLKIVGVILVFFGTVWFLQGINVLPGSFYDWADSMVGVWHYRVRRRHWFPTEG